MWSLNRTGHIIRRPKNMLELSLFGLARNMNSGKYCNDLSNHNQLLEIHSERSRSTPGYDWTGRNELKKTPWDVSNKRTVPVVMDGSLNRKSRPRHTDITKSENPKKTTCKRSRENCKSTAGLTNCWSRIHKTGRKEAIACAKCVAIVKVLIAASNYEKDPQAALAGQIMHWKKIQSRGNLSKQQESCKQRDTDTPFFRRKSFLELGERYVKSLLSGTASNDLPKESFNTHAPWGRKDEPVTQSWSIQSFSGI